MRVRLGQCGLALAEPPHLLPRRRQLAHAPQRVGRAKLRAGWPCGEGGRVLGSQLGVVEPREAVPQEVVPVLVPGVEPDRELQGRDGVVRAAQLDQRVGQRHEQQVVGLGERQRGALVPERGVAIALLQPARSEALERAHAVLARAGPGQRAVIQLDGGVEAQQQVLEARAVQAADRIQRVGGKELLEACAQMGDRLDSLDPEHIETSRRHQYQEAYPWFVGAALVMWFVVLALELTLWRRLP